MQDVCRLAHLLHAEEPSWLHQLYAGHCRDRRYKRNANRIGGLESRGEEADFFEGLARGDYASRGGLGGGRGGRGGRGGGGGRGG